VPKATPAVEPRTIPAANGIQTDRDSALIKCNFAKSS
jgi:hypothetical protein